MIAESYFSTYFKSIPNSPLVTCVYNLIIYKLIPNHQQALGEYDLTWRQLRMKQVRLHTLLLHPSASLRRLLRLRL